MRALRPLAAAMLAGSAACVPATEPVRPAGAAGFAIAPSEAAAGEPFSNDGWTLRFEKLVIRAAVAASPTDPSDGSYGSAETWLFDAQKGVEVYARALSVGPARVELALNGGYLGSNAPEFGDVTSIDVAPEDAARFARTPDGYAPQATDTRNLFEGPAVLFVVRAERGSERLVMDLALAVWPTTRNVEEAPVLDVRANALVVAPLGAVPERLFEGGFQRYAAADVNHDGRIAAEELLATEVEGARIGQNPADHADNLLEELSIRAGRIVLPAN